MSHIKRILLASFLLLTAPAASTVLAADHAPDAEAVDAQKKYNAALIDALLAEGTPRAMVLAATALPYAGDKPQAVVQRRQELLDTAAHLASDDPWVQWFTALNAQASETLSEPAQALLRLDPDNGAIWLFQLQAAIRAKDSTGVTEALTRIGDSRKFDIYHVEFALEWLKFFNSHPALHAPGYDGPMLAEAEPLVMGIARAAALAIPNYAGPLQACKPKDQPLTADRREACLAAGRLMLDESATLTSTQLGVAMLRLAGAPDAAEINRNYDYLVEEYTAISKAIFDDPAEFGPYEADWLHTRNEVQVARNVLLRAGLPLLPPVDWKSNPKRFMVKREIVDGG